MALAFLFIRRLDRRLAGTGRYRLEIIDDREKQGEKERFLN